MSSHPFRKILIANRGEIAIRIARAATELHIQTVSIYSYEDRFSLHRFKTDESYRIGTEGTPLKAYLDGDAIIRVALKVGAEAIHPGYGLLSENEDFRRRCDENGIVFMGPSADILRSFGDKSLARLVAKKAGLEVIPGSDRPLKNVDEARELAKHIGYPLTLKAVAGGGGKGIRMIADASQLEEAFKRAESEALTSFGKSDLYLEKTLLSPRHIEIQILGDQHGHIVHLFERDCSIQRRHQKVVEVAPALGISLSCRQRLQQKAVQLAQSVNYEGLGTVEFLVDENEHDYFLEVNPRIQVEHTVTEMVTGIDLVQASILVASGVPLSDPRIGIKNQESIECRGTAIQCRITTEDPLNQFAPDTGLLTVYRPAAGFGIRFDEGHSTAGEIITPYFDSLLVKVTAWAMTLEGAAAKMHRSLSEFRIRGVKHNIPLLKNIVQHPDFLHHNTRTDFLTKHKDVFEYVIPRDRATKLLRYIAEVTINDPHGLGPDRKRYKVDDARPPLFVSERKQDTESAKSILSQKGVAGLVDWIRTTAPHRLLLTDTTMRDAHQSLFATRLRTRDHLKVAPYYEKYLSELFSLEVWGGATFDTALRFLREDPWERLSKIREAIPNVLLQMLLRGDNAVGYANYPAWVIKDFVKESCARGLDIFRIFDCFNQVDKMVVAFEATKKHGAVAEVCLCYTGDVAQKELKKYDLAYYVKKAKEIEALGADILCIKDMAGLLRPQAASLLIRALKDAVELPIHFHTHDTSGTQVATALAASQAGCEIIDGAISSMAGLTSQPSLNAIVASLQHTPRDTRISLGSLDELTVYWAQVRDMYSVFDPGIKFTSTDVYMHEIPGGQYSNLFEQAKKVGLTAEEFVDLTKRYKEVNDLLGDVIKVTPSSKVVGDLALLLHKQGITGPQLMSERPALDYPDSLVSLAKGELGMPYGGLPDDVRTLVLGPRPPAMAPKEIPNDTREKNREHVKGLLGRPPTESEALSSRLYPKVFQDYWTQFESYGRLSELPTPIFFFGLTQGQEIEMDLEKGKTFYLTLEGISEPNVRGKRNVFFRLNGFQRVLEVSDRSIASKASHRTKGDPRNPLHVIAAMPGKVLDVVVSGGKTVKTGDVLVVTEAMKMEYSITAKQSGTVEKVHISKGHAIEAGDLLVELKA